MKGRLGVFAASLFAMGSSAVAVPTIGTFEVDDVGIKGCTSVAGALRSSGWDGPKYAVWKFESLLRDSKMTMSFDGSIETFPIANVTFNDQNCDLSVHAEWNEYKIVVNYEEKKRLGYETMTADGTLKVYSDTSGDSKTIPVTVAWGCWSV